MTTSDCSGKALNTSTYVINNTWIIDYGATDQMNFDSRQFLSLRHSSQKFIFTANGNMASVIREGSLTLTDTLNLNSVLFVSSLNYNLLPISQITVALSCIVIILLEFCVFKDIRPRQTISYGIKRGKLYYLSLQSKDSNKLYQALVTN